MMIWHLAWQPSQAAADHAAAAGRRILRERLGGDSGGEDDNEPGPSGPGDNGACEYDEASGRWFSGAGECPVEPDVSFADAVRSRACWLAGLLALQSCSGFILSRNEALLQDHPVIVYFLTMLVGAGENAGNQASVRVIRGLGEFPGGRGGIGGNHSPLSSPSL